MSDSRDIGRIFEEGSAIDEALARAALAARREYVKAGLSMPVWRDGQLVWVAPGDLDVDGAEGRHDPAA